MTVRELLDLVLRWIHLIAGIMWIGNSMLFNWIDRNLERPRAKEGRPGFIGDIWMVHSGGFYEMEKKWLQPHELPPRLHWFKWQNGFTWLSGISLLVVVYYLNADAYMVDAGISKISGMAAVAISVTLLLAAWLVYDVAFISFPGRVATVLCLAALVGVTMALTHLFSGRAAYIHVGVLLGTLMTGNVWLHILPSQKELVAATREGRQQDESIGKMAKQRSIHNNYMTFPLLFLMLSNHFPTTYGSPMAWLVLVVLFAASAGIRHMMNVRFGMANVRAWLTPIAAIAAAAIGLLFVLTAQPAATTAPRPASGTVSFAQVAEVLGKRCQPCHSATPSDKLFPAAPAGIMFDTPEQIQKLASRIKERAVTTKTMPFGNRTSITDEERALLGVWVDDGAKVGP